jgi:hypothetical protein
LVYRASQFIASPKYVEQILHFNSYIFTFMLLFLRLVEWTEQYDEDIV